MIDRLPAHEVKLTSFPHETDGLALTRVATQVRSPDQTGALWHSVIEADQEDVFRAGVDVALALANTQPEDVESLDFKDLFEVSDREPKLPNEYALGILSIAIAWQPDLQYDHDNLSQFHTRTATVAQL